MKRILAKFLVVLMMMTSVAIPAGEENVAGAAEKEPDLEISGAIKKINLLAADSPAQEVGKTITVTLKNAKKGNVKDITVYFTDPGIASVTQKTITKKKAGFKVKIKKLGKTHFSARITLKKKQNGQKVWWREGYIKGVKKMTQKEMNEVSNKSLTKNTHIALADSHGGYLLSTKEYDDKKNLTEKMEFYVTKDDMYMRREYIEKRSLEHIYQTANTGFEIYSQDGKFVEFFVMNPNQPFYTVIPVSDDPEEARAMAEALDCEYGYYDDLYYYCSEISNSKAETWDRQESVLDKKSCETRRVDFYRKNEAGEVYCDESMEIDTSAAPPDLYGTMKFQYSSVGHKKVKVEGVIDPGISEERRISMEIPQGLPVYLYPFEGYGIYTDAEGKTPLSDIPDTSDDVTVYYIKNADETN